MTIKLVPLQYCEWDQLYSYLSVVTKENGLLSLSSRSVDLKKKHLIGDYILAITFPAERSLRWLIDQPDGHAPTIPEEVVPSEMLLAVYDELAEEKLIHETMTTDRSFDFFLTSRGRAEANRMKSTYRHSLAQRKILDWLVQHPDSSPMDLLETPSADDFSGRLTHDEVVQAADELDHEGYIKGMKAWGSEMLRANLTSNGHRLHRSQMSIDQVNQAGGMTTMNVSANNYGNQTIGNQSFGGSGHTLNADFSSQTSPEDIAQVVEQFRAALHGASGAAEEKQDLVGEVNDIEKRLPKRGPSWALQALQLVATAALPVIGQESASALMALLPRSE